MENKELFIYRLGLCLLGLCFLSFVALAYYSKVNDRKRTIIVDWNSPRFIGERSGHYGALFVKYDADEELPDKVVEEILDVEFVDVRSNTELIKLYGISFKEGTLSDLAIQCNTELFDMANRFFLTSHNGEQLSPLIPMTIANIETPNRMDQSITYSSLFPSATVHVNNMSAIVNMSCVAVLESAETFNQLASDHWTRDRGALQMNPDYGVSLEAFNSLMGPSEESILERFEGTGLDTSNYSAYEARNSRVLTAKDWLDNLASTPGDRFNVKDSILRFASASQEAVDSYSSMYEIENEYEVVVMLAINHNSGSVWSPAFVTKKIGNWRSGTSAYSYTKSVTSNEFVKIVSDYCDTKLTEARKNGRKVPMTLERADAKKLYEEGVKAGLINPYSTYVAEGRYYEVTYCYPIQALYAYLMLANVYSGK